MTNHKPLSLLICIFLSQLFFFNSSSAQTGIAVPGMSNCDASISSFLTTYGIPGATVAISKNGKLVYARGFGNKNTANDPVYPHSIFRIASISKPITSIAVMKMIESGSLNLSDQVFGTGGILQNHPQLSMANITDNRIYNITVQHLLEHSGGWNRDLNCFPNPTTPYAVWRLGCDPIGAPLHITQVLGTGNPVSESDLIQFLLERGLDFTPGTNYAYSNIGYLTLGLVIEEISGLSYEEYVQNTVLEPLGICDMHIGKNLLAELREREANYFGNGGTTLSCYGTGNNVPWEYGGWNLEAMDAHGGWVSTASDMVKLLVAVDGFNSKPDLLNANSILSMTTASANNSSYAKGWSVNAFGNWWHTGALDGTASIWARTSGQYTWAILLNKRVINSQAGAFWGALDALPWNCVGNASSFPSHDLMLNPDQSASNLNFSVVSNNSVTLNWTNGTGGKRILIAKEGSAISDYPLDGNGYNASANFGTGDDLGNNSYVVYNGSGNFTTVNNLSQGTRYHFRLIEFNKNSTTGNYELYRICNSPQVDSVTTGVIGIGEIDFEDMISVYPNPSNGTFQVDLKKSLNDLQLNLYNSTGQILFRKVNFNDPSTTITLKEHSNGLYYLEFIYKGQYFRKKVSVY